MSDQPLAIRVEGLQHSYPPSGLRRARPRPEGAGGTHRALEGISFEVARGEFFGLLGPNGGGKTTLFKILSTLIAPSGGSAEIFGINVVRDPGPARTRIGVVFQSPALDKKLTVEENLTHQGHLYGLKGGELKHRIQTHLEQVGLWDRRGARVEALSGGLRRRAEIAKGLLHRPDMLILDEPSSGLDPIARREIWNQLETMRKKSGTTIVLTTHLMDEAEKCDRIAILDKGHLIALDEPDRLKAQIGGDVITLESDQLQELQRQIQERYAIGSVIVDDTLRIEMAKGHEFIANLVEAFPGKIRSIRLGKPTLEDVFVHTTGHGFIIAPEAAKERRQ